MFSYSYLKIFSMPSPRVFHCTFQSTKVIFGPQGCLPTTHLRVRYLGIFLTIGSRVREDNIVYEISKNLLEPHTELFLNYSILEIWGWGDRYSHNCNPFREDRCSSTSNINFFKNAKLPENGSH